MTTTLMLAVVSGVIALVTTLAVKADLHAAAEDRLQQMITRSQPFWDGGGGGGAAGAGRLPLGGGQKLTALDFLVNSLPEGSVGALVNKSGAVQAGTPTVSADNDNGPQVKTTTLTTAQTEALAAAAGSSSNVTVNLPGLGDFLVTSQVNPQTQDTRVIGVPLSSYETTINELIGVEATVTLAGLIIAGFLSFALIRISLRPLDRVAATAARISRVQLDRGEVGELTRVSEADTDTRTEAGQVGDSLNRLIDHVANALSARHASETRVRQFVADASHELRTPLASIAGYAELTRRGREAVPPDTAYALSRVESEAARMTRLVEDLLLLARLDAGRPLEREPLDLAPLVMDAVRDAHAANPDHNWQVQLPDDPVMVDGDGHRLHQVLVNLLANAGKHTPAGTRVTAAVVLSPDGVGCELRIIDDGPGIPPALLPSVFERFARGDSSRSRAAGSTGLGLAIVAAVTASHGGTVGVRSRPGNTVFTVRLPLSAEPAKDLDLLVN
ncbi:MULTISPECIES: HAMP domain-containing sensor histidine kinase [Streptacidiphilus]|uniref:histidine kinase n=1 Tax=Streptacidiphilus cavernicola TaxID=3342716 RepID=A0ABV6UG80_9ACTN|nr:HAMP domain-containing sensor histidine kinase [Streptacidiphilus jeojiense]